MTDRRGDADGLGRNVGVVGLCVMASRVTGLLREMVLAYFLKAEYGLDAFYAAFRIPNLFRDLFGEGVLSKAFIAVLSDSESSDGPAAAARLARSVIYAVLVIVGGVVAAGIVFAPWIVDLMVPGRGFDVALPEGSLFGIATKRELTVLLTRVMFPFLLTVSLAAVLMGMLNSRGRFAVPASASIFFNLGSVLFGVAGYLALPKWGLHPAMGLAVGVVLGGVLQWAVQVPAARRAGYSVLPRADFANPRLREVGRLLGPSIVGVAAIQVNVFVNSIFASLGEGWLTWISQAFRLMHLPIGLFGVAVSTVALPNMARSLAEGRLDRYRDSLNQGLKLVLAMTIPSALGLIALDRPIIRLIFERGRFTPHDTEQAAAALSCYAIGLAGYASVKILTDAFYARKDTRTPVGVSLVAIILNIGLNAVFVLGLRLGHRGLALSTALTLTLNALVLFALLRRRIGPLGGRDLALLVLRLIAASVPMALVARAAANAWAANLGLGTLILRLGQVGCAIAAGILVFGAAASLLRVREVREAVAAFLGPLSRRPRPPR